MLQIMSTTFRGWVSVTIFLLCAAQTFTQKFAGDTCILKNGRPGICKNIYDCRTALEGIKRKVNPVHCGFDGLTVVVCCENDETTTTIQPSTLAPRIDSSIPGNVASHMCKEYGKYVFKITPDVGFSFETGNRNESSCKLQKPDGFIIGGKDADLEEIPHAVAIGFGKEPEIAWRCTGSLISEKWVLTAAHCNSFASLGFASYIRTGFVKFDSNKGSIVPIIERIKYPKYSRTSYYNDISLMKLETPLTFSSELRPACLRYDPNINEEFILAVGWGLTDWRVERTSEILQKVSLHLYEKSICDGNFLDNPKLKNGVNQDSQLCIGAREGGRDTCNGDSGGPVSLINSDVYCMHDIVGVTSVGSKFCGTINSVGLYTRVFHYLDWIEKIVWPEFFK